jgi:hypothetical protein
MANVFPIANGNWSDSAIWSGSLVPTASDDVFLGGKIITLDQNTTIRSLRNTSSGSIPGGGQLYIYGDYNITATPNGFFPLAQASNGLGLIQYYNTGSITLTGNMPLNLASSTSVRGISNINTGTINFIGDVFGFNSGTISWCLYNSINGIINVIGNITAGRNGSSYGLYNASNGTCNVTGNIYGGPTLTTMDAIYNANIGMINVTGNVEGGSNTLSYGINNVNIGIINITGNITASGSAGINSTTAGIINVIGQLQASTTANAVSSTSTTATNIFSGPFINSGSRNAIYCYNVRLYDDVTTRYTIGVSGSTDTISILSPDQVTGVPSGSDVRIGTIYGPGNELTGSMAVPHPNSVSIGVAVDQTVGTALVKPEDIWNIALTSLSSSNSIGQRLANTISSQSMDAIISAF